MIVTVTLNPSLDRTIEVDAPTRGAVVRPGPRSWTRAARASTCPGVVRARTGPVEGGPSRAGGARDGRTRQPAAGTPLAGACGCGVV
ncbi:hypothetical protein SAMN06265355_12058 [Actinomadura mexicana]|uniref:1-phosphofructokinase n=1 Tax=Actinomadura mexicana TaxID=134959 RepID=A0A239FD00_9ACTN|nr:hypothetical protein SAMN06265355_12058 [Actinomadura mexicana]